MIKSVLTLAALSVVFTGCGGKGGDDTGATVDTSVTDTSSTTTDTGGTTTDTGGTTTDTATATDTGDTDTTTTIEGAPSAPVVAISPEDPAEGEEHIVCGVTEESVDEEGDVVTYTWSWAKNGVEWAGFVKDTDNVGDSIAKLLLLEGDVWECSVTPNDGAVDGPAGSASVTVGPAPESDTALFMYRWEGGADLTPDSDGAMAEWAGSESLMIYNVTDGNTTACEHAYTTASTAPLSTCADCTFAFDVDYTNSVATGDLCAVLGLVSDPNLEISYTWGYAETVEYNGSTYYSTLMYYVPSYSNWIPFGTATVVVDSNGGARLDYLTPEQYFYYYSY